MDTESVILVRAHDAISRSQTRPVGPISRNYTRSGENPPGSKPVADEMIEEFKDYSAEVIIAPKDVAILDAINELFNEVHSVVVPVGLSEGYKKAAARGGRAVVEDSREEATATFDLNEIDVVLICSRMGISILRTIVLDDKPDQGHWAISLASDKHAVVLERETVTSTVSQAVDVPGEHPIRPMIWIAGSPAISDIELVCVSGVYGSRNLYIVIVH